jgi:ubiquinone/menaquinone biosynthesis C-methylase UbiE
MTQTPAETRSPHFGREATAQIYRDIHLPRIFAPWARVLLEVVPPSAGDAVLDVATGPGTVARQAAVLVGSGGRVVGVDLSGAMLSIARSFAAEPGAAPLEYVEAPATCIPLADASFDVAYCQQGLQHMADAQAALREIHRLVRRGGRLGVAAWVQSPFGLFREIVRSVGAPDNGPQPSEFGHDAADFASALRDAGFEDVDVQRREMVSSLEGGIPQALEVAVATSAGAQMAALSEAQQEAIRAAIVGELEPRVRDGVVYLTSISHIASARRT